MLSAEQKLFYQTNGYVLVPAMLDMSEAASLRAEMHAIAASQGPSDATWDSVRNSGTAITAAATSSHS